jgi:hypothetical protein
MRGTQADYLQVLNLPHENSSRSRTGAVDGGPLSQSRTAVHDVEAPGDHREGERAAGESGEQRGNAALMMTAKRQSVTGRKKPGTPAYRDANAFNGVPVVRSILKEFEECGHEQGDDGLHGQVETRDRSSHSFQCWRAGAAPAAAAPAGSGAPSPVVLA